MIRRPPRDTQSRSSAASDVYKRQVHFEERQTFLQNAVKWARLVVVNGRNGVAVHRILSLIHISEPTRPY